MRYSRSYFVSPVQERILQLHEQMQVVQRNMHRSPAMRLQAVAIKRELEHLYKQW